MMEEYNDQAIISHPAAWIVTGSSQSGKTYFTMEVIRNVDKLFSVKLNKIIISYTEYQSSYEAIRCLDDRISFVKGFDPDLVSNLISNTLLIVDDQMTEAVNNKKIVDLFTKGVHHNSCSVIFITQNLFVQGKYSRDIRLNTHYITIFKSPTAKYQLSFLERQLFPGLPKFLVSAYSEATREPYSYLFLNLHPNCSENLRVSSNIIPIEDRIIYIAN